MSININTFKEHIADFTDYRLSIGYAQPQTVQSNKKDVNLFLAFLEMKNIEDIDGPAVIDFQKYLSQQRLNAPASANRKIFSLKAYQNFLDLKEIADYNDMPFHKVRKIRNAAPLRPNYLNLEEIEILFNCFAVTTVLGIRNYTIYSIMFLLGLRVGEVHRLNINSIDFRKKEITIIGKKNQQRTLPLLPEMISILKDYLQVRPHFLNSSECDALFISKKGKRIAIRTIEDNFKKLLEKSGIHKPFNVTCHTLRHSQATLLNEKGVDVLVIQNILGHSSPRTTIRYYIHATEKQIREAMERLPITLLLNELVDKGVISFTFQKAYSKKAG